jgi:hypothetical protein
MSADVLFTTISMVTWLVITIPIFAVARTYRSERSSLYCGSAFIFCAVIAYVFLTSFRLKYYMEQHGGSDSANLIELFVQFALFTWGAMGSSLLTKTIEHTDASPKSGNYYSADKRRFVALILIWSGVVSIPLVLLYVVVVRFPFN